MSPARRTLSLANRGINNYLRARPFCISFEVTYQCNAKCKHCHLGKPFEGVEKRATPQFYAERYHEIKPLIAQVSGGEPLLRKDLEDIIKALKVPNKAPYIIVTTNGALLTKNRYEKLREAGVDSFSLSLDYPDERHDEFRGIPGLFGRIKSLLEELCSVKNKGITLSGVVQRDNYKDLIQMAELARNWNTKLNFSAYTWLRTNNKKYIIPKDELPEFRVMVNQLIDFKRRYDTIYTSNYVLKRMVDFFDHQGLPNCRAGERFLVVNPDGSLSPCGLIMKNYNSQKEIIENFSMNNTCGECYTSLRANTEKPTIYLIKDSMKSL